MPVIAPHSPRWPRVVAEALATVAWPHAVTGAPLRPGDVDAVRDAWTHLVTPARDAATPPPFLLPHQHDPWRRLIAALERWPGALLVEAVGRGKSWIALGAAARLGGSAMVIGPAILEAQWRDAASRAGVSMAWWSYERLSRGRLPEADRELVILDEAHRLREPATSRVRTLAPWLGGRRTILLTATPIVNRLDDLVALLRLILPEDALRLDGIATLEALLRCDAPPAALARVVIRGVADRDTRMTRARVLEAAGDEETRGARAVALIADLTARHRAGWSRLLASVLLDAAMSSDAALLDALGRYRALLRQARDAGSGDRAMLRRFAGVTLDQLVWWDLIGVDGDTAPLPVEELPTLESHLAEFVAADRGWLDAVRRVLGDEVPTVCFTRHRATAALVRTLLGDGTAWVTGDAAGIGPHRLPRGEVLAAFGPSRAAWRARRRPPVHLVATDVAAEGLDLQAAGRLVHLDLPWTAMRIAQREGRLLRIGQRHAEVELVVRRPAAPIEAALARTVRVARKGALADRWLAGLSTPAHAPIAAEGAPWAVVVDPTRPDDADVVLLEVRDGTAEGAMLLHRVGDAPWRIELSGTLPDSPTDRRDTGGIAEIACRRVADEASRWALRELHRRPAWGPPRLVARLHRLARLAAWERNAAALGRLERTLRWCTRAPTLGDRLQLESLAGAPDAAVVASEAPPRGSPPTCQVVVRGVVLYRSAPVALR